MKPEKWIVTATLPSGAVCFRDTVDAYSERTAVDTAARRDDGTKAYRNWPDAKWTAEKKAAKVVA